MEQLPLAISKIEYIFPAPVRIPGLSVRSRYAARHGTKIAAGRGKTMAIAITVEGLEPLKFKLVPFPPRDLSVKASLKYRGNGNKAIFTFTGQEITEVLTALDSTVLSKFLKKAQPAIQPRLSLGDLQEQLIAYILELER